MRACGRRYSWQWGVGVVTLMEAMLSQDGDTRDDFRIETTDRSIHILNAPSPAATASLAIGDYVADRFQERFTI